MLIGFDIEVVEFKEKEESEFGILVRTPDNQEFIFKPYELVQIYCLGVEKIEQAKFKE